MGLKKIRRANSSWIIAGLSASMIVLAACGGNSESTGDQPIREAAAVPEQSGQVQSPSASTSPSGMPTAEVSDAASSSASSSVAAASPEMSEGDSPTDDTSEVLAQGKGPGGYCVSTTYRCVSLNFTNQYRKTIYVSIDGGEMGRQKAYITPNSSHQFVGYDGGWGRTDVSGELYVCKFEDSASRGRCENPAGQGNGVAFLDNFSARNPQIGKPSFGFDLGPAGSGTPRTSYAVGDRNSYVEGDGYSGSVAVDVTRLPDSSTYVNFELTVRKP